MDWCEHGNELLGCVKCGEISRLTEGKEEEETCPIEVVSSLIT